MYQRLFSFRQHKGTTPHTRACSLVSLSVPTLALQRTPVPCQGRKPLQPHPISSNIGTFVLYTINTILYMSHTFLSPKGGYRSLKAYQVAELIYDITYYFATHYLNSRDRTVDQMIQAARSGKQNIAEGSKASTTSTETEIKLTNVAKASLEELLIDYEDYLRVNRLPLWDETHERYQMVREYARSERIKVDYLVQLPKLNNEEIANLCITLIHQATFLLRKLINRQQEQFLTDGGIREQMSRARRQFREEQRR